MRAGHGQPHCRLASHIWPACSDGGYNRLLGAGAVGTEGREGSGDGQGRRRRGAAVTATVGRVGCSPAAAVATRAGRQVQSRWSRRRSREKGRGEVIGLRASAVQVRAQTPIRGAPVVWGVGASAPAAEMASAVVAPR